MHKRNVEMLRYLENLFLGRGEWSSPSNLVLSQVLFLSLSLLTEHNPFHRASNQIPN